ncbi:radical SAM protein [Niastella caeni]|uniref:radical SAM protein n=1 Tax=Niastella caeni TaxID=2569763 RepID=UPI00140D924C|nr:radical SAM protein [Niastella caeni]
MNCNLRCKHCYSSSAPGIKKELAFDALANIIGQAAEVGYNVISMSGGEPFMYQSLEELVRFSKSAGYFNSVTTNGMLLKGSRAKNILKYVDLIAVSIDGKEEMHDHMRSQPGAFKKMREGVAILRDSINYGFIHTLLPDSWKILSWLAGFAVDEKASLLHLHPLEMSGRATQHLGGLLFDQTDLYKIYISHYYLNTYFENDIFIQLDLLHRNNIKNNPNFVFHESCKPQLCASGFSTIFKELIINEKGDILPIAHGCSPFFTIGNIYSGEKLQYMIGRFMHEKMGYIIDLFQATYDNIMLDKELEIVNWSEMVIQKSHTLFPKEQLLNTQPNQ